jgi:type I restriction enzyme S subunit
MGDEVMGMWEMPEGWKWVPLESVVLKTERRNPAKPPDEPFIYVDISSIDSKIGAIVDPRRLQGREAPSRARKVIRSGDVIFAITRPYLRNIALVPDRYDDQICSTGFCVLQANRELLDPSWLYHLCRSDVVLDQVLPRMRGASYPAVTDGDVLTSEIPLPPLDEQRRIVARIEELFARIEEARRLRAAADEDAERLMSAALEEIFREAETEGWPIKTVGNVIEGKPQYGTSQKASEEPVGVPILRMGNIVDDQVSFDSLKYINLPPDEEAKYLLREGDILFNRTNSAELVGKSAVYPGGRRAVFASYLIRIVADCRKAMPHFVAAYINSPLGRQYIQSQLTRAIGQVNVNAKKLQAMPIPVPPLPEQRRIVEYLDGVQAQVVELKRLQAESAAELERLSGAVLARAFRGEL